MNPFSTFSVKNPSMLLVVLWCLQIYKVADFKLAVFCICRISCQETYWGSSRTATAGRSSGWSSPTSACFSTSHTRTIIHLPAFLCWVTPSPSRQSLKTSTRTMSLNCISSPTSTTSDRRVNTLLKGGWRSSAVQRSPPVELAYWTAKSPILTELAHLVSTRRLPWVASALPVTWTLCFSFYTYLGHLYMCPCTFGAF